MKQTLIGRIQQIASGVVHRIAGGVFGLQRWLRYYVGRLVWLFRTWLATRPRTGFLKSLPVVIASVIVMVLVVLCVLQRPDSILSRYRLAAQSALQNDDADSALVYNKRLFDLGDDRPAVIYGRVVIADKQGQKKSALELASRIAPEDGVGYGFAHRYLAEHLRRLPLDERQSGWIDRLIHHLEAAIEKDAKPIEAHAVLGQVLVAGNRLEDALPHLRAATFKRPDLNLVTARTCVLLGRKTDARTYASHAQAYYEKLRKANPRDAAVSVSYAETLLFQEQFTQSIKVLKSSMAFDSERRVENAIGRHFTVWYDTVSRSEPDNFERRMQILQSAMQHSPENGDLMNRLSLLSAQAAGRAKSIGPQPPGGRPTVGRPTVGVVAQGASKDAASESHASQLNQSASEIQAAVKKNLETGKTPALSHLILGSTAYDNGGIKNAIFHLEQAYKIDSRMPEIVNNLAWFIAHDNPPQLARAKQLADRLIRLAPRRVQFRETRGQILALAGDWSNALADLQMALRVMPDYQPLHATLAKAYEHFGQTSLAAKHRDKSGYLLKNP